MGQGHVALVLALAAPTIAGCVQKEYFARPDRHPTAPASRIPVHPDRGEAATAAPR